MARSLEKILELGPFDASARPSGTQDVDGNAVALYERACARGEIADNETKERGLTRNRLARPWLVHYSFALTWDGRYPAESWSG